MTSIDPKTIVRAWRDPKFAAGLPEDVRRRIPASPAGAGVTDLGMKLDGGRIEPQGTVASSCNTVASECNTVASSCNTVASSCNTVASTCNTVSSSCNTVASSCNTVASECNTVASSCNTVASSCDTRTSCTRVVQCRG